MTAAARIARALRRSSTPLMLCALLAAIVVATSAANNAPLNRTVTEALIRVVFVVGLYVFVGSSGVVSFGHAAFMALGAYATAWQDCCSMTKSFYMPALPKFMLDTTVPPPAAVVGSGLFAALFALVMGAAIMRLSGIGASIATFAMLAIVNVVYSNWDGLTAGTSSIVGISSYTDHWVGLAWAAFAVVVAYLYQTSRFGLSLRASRDDEVAAKAARVHVVRQRLIAFVISAFLVGVSGGLYAHFLGTISVDAFYLDVTLITLAMLVIGGVNSLSGAVIGPRGDDRQRDRRWIDHARANHSRDVQTEKQKSDEIEERRPHHRPARRQHARRNDGRDRVCRIVKTVDEIESEGQKYNGVNGQVFGHRVLPLRKTSVHTSLKKS